ncbi:MAG: hypothetical protein J6N76_03905 [Lachnospiraceae bacterium]|nr:hypothetical protein [Lachnospiraceae bacterium]
MAGYNIGGLFGGASSNMFSDYAAIKNGSYNRLLKSYYSSEISSKSGSSDGRASSNVLDRNLEEKKNPTVSKSVAEANSALSAGVGAIKNALGNMQKEDLYKDSDNKKAADKVTEALSNYVKYYNSTVNATKKSTNTGMTSHIADLMKATRDNSKALENAGIYLKNDGTLYINEGKAKKADIDDIKALFSSDDKAYGGAVGKSVTGAGYYNSSNTKTNDTVETSSDSVSKDTVSSYEDLKTDIELFKRANYSKSDMDSLVGGFVSGFNSLIGSARLSSNEGVAANLGNLLSRTKEHQSILKEIGISADKNGNLTLDKNKLNAADTEKAKSTLKKFSESIETSTSLIKYYTQTNAGSKNTYNAFGLYNN